MILTYKEFVKDCKEKGIEPMPKRRFLHIAMLCNFPIAEEDAIPCMALAYLSTNLTHHKEQHP